MSEYFDTPVIVFACANAGTLGQCARQLIAATRDPVTPPHALAARHNAIEVSSVHSPGFSLNGPPPTMSLMGANESGELNSSVVPTASPMASPNKQPLKCSIVSTVNKCRSSCAKLYLFAIR